MASGCAPVRENVARRESHAACGRDRFDLRREDIVGDNAWRNDDGVREMLGGVDVLLKRRAGLRDKLEVPTQPVVSKYSYIARLHYALRRS